MRKLETVYVRERSSGSCLPPAGVSHGAAVATVDGKTITKADVDVLVSQGTKRDTPELRAILREKLIEEELLMDEAARRSIPELADVEYESDARKRSFVIAALLHEDFEKHRPSDADLLAEYDRQKELQGDQEYGIHEIMLASEAHARAVISRLDKREVFEDLSENSSLSARAGVDLVWVPRVVDSQPIVDAIRQPSVGSYTARPVYITGFWHVIRLDSVRPFPAFDESKAKLLQELRKKQVGAFIVSMKQNAAIFRY